MTGGEGYVESAASGLLCGLSLGRDLRGLGTVELPGITALGAMGRYISTPNKHFQPMNCAFGLIDGLVVDKQHKKIRNKQERYTVISERSLAFLRDWQALRHPGDLYQMVNSSGEDIRRILSALGVDLRPAIYTKGGLSALKAKVKVF